MPLISGEPLQCRGACFDLYSTLVHEDPANPFYENVAAGLGVDLGTWLPAYRKRGSDAMLGRLAGMGDRVLASIVDAGYSRSRDEVDSVVDRCFPLFVKSVGLDPRALDALGHLRDTGFRLALVSNASSYSEEILDHSGLRGCFDTVVLSYRVRLLKPDPAIYRLALSGLGLRSADCFFVGDGGDRELHGAREAGMHTVLVDRGLAHSQAAKADADTVIRDLAQLRGLVIAAASVTS